MNKLEDAEDKLSDLSRALEIEIDKNQNIQSEVYNFSKAAESREYSIKIKELEEENMDLSKHISDSKLMM